MWKKQWLKPRAVRKPPESSTMSTAKRAKIQRQVMELPEESRW